MVQGGTVHDQALRVVQGGTRLAAAVRRKVGGNDRHWVVTVTPDGHADIRMNLSSGAACGTDHAICTADERALSNGLSATVQGPAGLSVADARVEEAADATVDFAVTLSRASSRTVTVDYATSDGTATAGSDYTATSGTLTFAAGEREKTVAVPVLDDDHDEGEETFTLPVLRRHGHSAHHRAVTRKPIPYSASASSPAAALRVASTPRSSAPGPPGANPSRQPSAISSTAPAAASRRLPSRPSSIDTGPPRSRSSRQPRLYSRWPSARPSPASGVSV